MVWRGWWLVAAGIIVRGGAAGQVIVSPDSLHPSRHAEVRLIALGDVNLGRSVGKMLLRGDTLLPFKKLADTLFSYDVAFANLESPLSDQNGETEDPRSNYVFTGPPVGAIALRRGGVTVVATANNHALDYGRRGHAETLKNLDSAGIAHAGSGLIAADTYAPARFTVHGVRILLFACTDVMNIRSPGWDTLVAAADTARLFPQIRKWRDSADFVILSYHGGAEYTETPVQRTILFTRSAAEAGVDLVLGHHPHVPFGVVREGKSIVAHSLGNCVFQQPSRFWTRHGLALAVRLVVDGTDRSVEVIRCLPVRCGYQPEILPPGADAARLLERVKRLSTGAAEEWFTWRSQETQESQVR
jgi:poly-gamma-glutamate capsule biosynthesis protein CapA/YwtB (metallophosphatase superfamily)